MAIPRITAECAFSVDATTDPPRADAAWKDFSDFLLPPFGTKAGRQRELNRIEAGTVTAQIDNRDRRFDAENTAGPYYPNVLPMRHVRFIAGYLGEVLKDKPIRYYRLSDGAGAASAAAEVGSAAGTYLGTPTLSTVGLIAGRTCMDADGTDDRVSIADHADLDLTTVWSIECWINPDTVATKGLVVRATGGSANPADGYVVRLLSSGEIEYETATRSPKVTTSGAGITAGGGWYHVLVTFDNAASPKCRIYVNGVERGSGSPPAPANLAVTLLIAREGPAATFFDGQIGEVALYTAKLSASRALVHYQEGAQRIADGDLFRGFTDGWPQKWPDENDAIVELACTDAFKVFANVSVSESLWELQIALANPDAWYRLGEPAGSTVMIDAAKSAHGQYLGAPTLGAEGLLQPYDSDSAARGFTAGSYSVGVADFSAPGDFTVEVWFTASSDPLAQQTIVDLRDTNDPASFLGMEIRINVTDNVQGVLRVAGTPASTITGPIVTDGKVHHAVLVRRVGTSITLIVDGVLIGTSSTFSGGSALATPGDEVHVGNSLNPGQAANGTVDEVVIWKSALSNATILDHYNYGAKPFAGLRTDQAISLVLDAIAWPVTLRYLDAGKSIMQATKLGGGSALDFFQKIAATEEGLLLMLPDGRLRFANRHTNLIAPGNVSQATFSDDPAADPGSLSYRDLVLEFDEVNVYNEIRMAREGSSVQVVGDAASQSKYLKRALENLELVCNSDLEVTDHANWRLSRQKDPKTEVRSMVLAPEIDVNLWIQALMRAIGDLLTVKRRPPGGGAAISKEVRIEGRTQTWTGQGWETAFWLSGFDSQRYWILGDPTYGLLEQTTRLAF